MKIRNRDNKGLAEVGDALGALLIKGGSWESAEQVEKPAPRKPGPKPKES